MKRFDRGYLEEVVETQGKLFDYIAHTYPTMDTYDFMASYLTSKTRGYMDDGQAYVLTMDYKTLWQYFLEIDHYTLKPGKALQGFRPMWMGEFYAYYQWYYGLHGKKTLCQVPLDYLANAYFGLCDLDLRLAVEKVGYNPSL